MAIGETVHTSVRDIEVHHCPLDRESFDDTITNLPPCRNPMRFGTQEGTTAAIGCRPLSALATLFFAPG
jgi:hypothetical protein